ncbi:hypothetical protein ANAPC3_00621 [Anaplasma phagocytophilum]|nr:hypothetical protein ANAPC2_00677 [Anaplasma phagocytophilum]SBO31727.1 hypothetical protein ANAPC3_00621 [Anaplasma phagocytophilum]SBO32188.1 hypothetical protein ANAPC4_00725 [Anaplasma phagocytophilum]
MSSDKRRLQQDPRMCVQCSGAGALVRFCSCLWGLEITPYIACFEHFYQRLRLGQLRYKYLPTSVAFLNSDAFIAV